MERDDKVKHPDDNNVAGNLVGEGVGGVSGIAAGAALGSLGGPVGAVIGALAADLFRRHVADGADDDPGIRGCANALRHFSFHGSD